MSRKRNLLPDIYKPKRKCLAQTNVDGNHASGEVDTHLTEIPNDTLRTLLYLRQLFPTDKFEFKLPPIVFRHQLYSVLKNKTTVDKQVNELKQKGEIKIFNIGALASDHSISIVFIKDYEEHVQRVMQNLGISQHVIDKFLELAVKVHNVVSLDRETLIDFGFKEEEISQLVKASVLNMRDIGSWWLSIPGAGVFVKSFLRGRKAMLTMIRKCKYREILQEDLLQRKWPRLARLGVRYHIYDITGADLVQCIQTTSGNLLRLKE